MVLRPSDAAPSLAVYREVVVLGRVGTHEFADCVLVPVGGAGVPTIAVLQGSGS